MYIIGKSDLLKEVEKRAVMIEGDGKLFTAERFIIELIDMVVEMPEEEKSGEFLRAEHILRRYLVKLEDVKSLLTAYARINKYPEDDSVYMQERMELAGEFSLKNGYEAVEVNVLLATILAEPSGIIKEITRVDKKSNEADMIYLHGKVADAMNRLVDDYCKAKEKAELLKALDEFRRWLDEQEPDEEPAEQ